MVRLHILLPLQVLLLVLPPFIFPAGLPQKLKGSPTSRQLFSLVGYHEPSAVFHLGRDILLLNADQAAVFMADSKDGLAVVESQNGRFLWV